MLAANVPKGMPDSKLFKYLLSRNRATLPKPPPRNTNINCFISKKKTLLPERNSVNIEKINKISFLQPRYKFQ